MHAVSTERAVVISDLHLSALRGEGLFQADAELTDFLRGLADVPSTLVLAGDAFDFLVPPGAAAPSSTFDETRAVELAGQILQQHDEVMSALERLCAGGRHRVLIQAGNHDPELALPAVREVFDKRLGLGRAGGWLVNGEGLALQVGSARVLVEHGDAIDPWNKIEHGLLGEFVRLASRGFEARFELPPGSHLVNGFVTPMRREGRAWVELLKPEREAVFPLLASFLGWRKRVKFAAQLQHLAAAKSREVRMAFAKPGDAYKGERDRFATWLERLTGDDSKGDDERSVDELIAELREVSAEDGYYDVARPDSALEHTRALLARGFHAVVHGHTHAAKGYEVDSGLYLNSGTWGLLLALPSSQAPAAEWKTFYESLRDNSAAGALRPTWVQLEKNAQGAHASLNQWQRGALAQFQHTAGEWNPL